MSPKTMPQDNKTSKTFRIHDWDKWQSYRTDRHLPPWMENYIADRCSIRSGRGSQMHKRGS